MTDYGTVFILWCLFFCVRFIDSVRFLQRVSIALAMQSAVLAMIDSVCLTV